MLKLKKGKLNQKNFWLVMLILCGLMAALMLVGVDYKNGKILSFVRIMGLLVLLIFYLIAMIMRLQDAGKSKLLLVICFFVPLFMFVIGAWPSETESAEEKRVEVEKVQKAERKNKHSYGKF